MNHLGGVSLSPYSPGLVYTVLPLIFIRGKGHSPFSETNDMLQKPQAAIPADDLCIIAGVDPDTGQTEAEALRMLNREKHTHSPSRIT